MNSITLYKYRAVNEWSLQALRSGRMWFSLPARLNDTFEFSVPVFISIGPTELVEHYEKRFKIGYIAPKLLELMMRYGGSGSFPLSDEFIQSFLVNSDEDARSLYVISLIHFFKEQGLTAEEIATRLKLHSNKELRTLLESDLRESYARNQAIGFRCGVLSFSSHCDDPLLWAHYADSCKGLCIGVTFDLDELIQSDFTPLWVKYADELPLLDPAKFFDRTQENVTEMLTLFYGTKHKAWSHEAEFRLLSPRGDVTLEVPGRITEVILGEKIEATAAEQVLETIQPRSGTKLLKMMREPGTWRYRAYGSSV